MVPVNHLASEDIVCVQILAPRTTLHGGITTTAATTNSVDPNINILTTATHTNGEPGPAL